MILKVILRCFGVVLGIGLVFWGLIPWLGLVSDWDTLTNLERLLCGIFSGCSLGTGAVLILWLSGLLDWVADRL